MKNGKSVANISYIPVYITYVDAYMQEKSGALHSLIVCLVLRFKHRQNKNQMNNNQHSATGRGALK